MLQNLWGRPPGLRGTPSSRSPPVESRPCTRRWPTRASAADEGVRPTIYSDVRVWENYVALTVRERSRDEADRSLTVAARLLHRHRRRRTRHAADGDYDGLCAEWHRRGNREVHLHDAGR